VSGIEDALFEALPLVYADTRDAQIKMIMHTVARRSLIFIIFSGYSSENTLTSFSPFLFFLPTPRISPLFHLLKMK
jgi:hypothetical protein